MTSDLGPTTIAVCWVFTSLATIFASLRLISRFRLSHYGGWDDLFIITSMVSLQKSDFNHLQPNMQI